VFPELRGLATIPKILLGYFVNDSTSCSPVEDCF
jgi:hypothetical protein